MTALYAILCAPPDEAGPASGQLTANLLGMPDSELLQKLRGGDEWAFEAMYRAFHPRLVAIATAYVGRAEAEEIAQEVLLHVWDQRVSWRPQHGVAAYL